MTPAVFNCVDDCLWNILIYGMERVCDDIANDCATCSCVIDSAFWLLTKPEQCSEACRLFIHLLTGVNIVCVSEVAMTVGPMLGGGEGKGGGGWAVVSGVLLAPGRPTHPTCLFVRGFFCFTARTKSAQAAAVHYSYSIT